MPRRASAHALPRSRGGGIEEERVVGLLCLIYVTATRLSSMASISACPSVDWGSGIGSGRDPRGGRVAV